MAGLGEGTGVAFVPLLQKEAPERALQAEARVTAIHRDNERGSMERPWDAALCAQ